MMHSWLGSCKVNTFTPPIYWTSIPSSTSHGWYEICIRRNLLQTQLGKFFGNEKSTQIWKEPCQSLTTLLTPVGPPPENRQNLTVAHFIFPTTVDWNGKIQQIQQGFKKQSSKLKWASEVLKTFVWLPTKT